MDRTAPATSLQKIVIPYPRVSLADVLGNAVLALVGVAFALPLLWMIFASLDKNAGWRIRLPNLTLENFGSIVTAQGLQPFVNSFYLAAVTTVVATALALLAAYPLSRRYVPGKRSVTLLILFASGLPVTMMLVPIYQMYATLHWLDSRFTTSLFLAATALPFAIWLLMNYISAVPLELEEAAGIEGAGTLRTLFSVVMPLILPGLCVTAVYNFITAWGAFIVPLVLDSTPEDQPGTVAIYQFLGAHGMIQFGQLSAFSLLFSLPVVVLYLLIGR
ncbi:MAG TPA: carbohydrate ABC transporter permease, partial [Acetobacteraceae bacterium]|nr:carbohydrate ABC transporter permease [Acetobacteraceae bacterium]